MVLLMSVHYFTTCRQLNMSLTDVASEGLCCVSSLLTLTICDVNSLGYSVMKK